VYGEGLCEAALVSNRLGKARMWACDQWEHKDHKSHTSKAHKGLPRFSGPRDVKSWGKVKKLSQQALKSARGK
jgi:hypothetical protein